MFLWSKEIIGFSTNPFVAMATSSFSSSEASLKIENTTRLNIEGIGPVVDKEIAVHFNNDNYLVVKEKLFDTWNIVLILYPQLANYKNIFGSD